VNRLAPLLQLIQFESIDLVQWYTMLFGCQSTSQNFQKGEGGIARLDFIDRDCPVDVDVSQLSDGWSQLRCEGQ
jgi:hypothetical protein